MEHERQEAADAATEEIEEAIHEAEDELEDEMEELMDHVDMPPDMREKVTEEAAAEREEREEEAITTVEDKQAAEDAEALHVAREDGKGREAPSHTAHVAVQRECVATDDAGCSEAHGDRD